MDWLIEADPVLAWLNECVEVRDVVDSKPSVATRIAYEAFRPWAIMQGFKKESLPALNGFTRRVLANLNGVTKGRTGTQRLFLGMVIR